MYAVPGREPGRVALARAARAIEMTTKLRKKKEERKEKEGQSSLRGSKARTRDSWAKLRRKEGKKHGTRDVVARAGGAPASGVPVVRPGPRVVSRRVSLLGSRRSRFQPDPRMPPRFPFYPRAFASRCPSSFASSTPAVFAVVGPLLCSPLLRESTPPGTRYRHRHRQLLRLPSNPFTVAQGHAAGPGSGPGSGARSSDNGQWGHKSA